MKRIIKIENAPPAVGPYSQAVVFNNIIFISSQYPIDPITRELVGNDIRTQTRRVLQNLKAIIESSDISISSVLKCHCYLRNIEDLDAFNEIYANFFGKGHYPARDLAEVGHLAKGALVSVSAICGR